MRLLLAVLGGAAALIAQVQRTTDAQVIEARQETEKKLQAIAIVERKIMVSMRDGKRMAADVYRPKDESKKYPAIFVRTPYNFNFWDVKLGAPRDMTQELEAVKRGYAFVEMNERGHFFSEGNYDILGAPLSDGWDAIDWISKQTWSSGKVGTIGCSSTAEWQMAVAAMGHPAFTTMVLDAGDTVMLDDSATCAGGRVGVGVGTRPMPAPENFATWPQASATR